MNTEVDFAEMESWMVVVSVACWAENFQDASNLKTNPDVKMRVGAFEVAPIVADFVVVLLADDKMMMMHEIDDG